MNWHLLDLKEIESTLQTDLQNGLTQAEAETRQTEYGENEIIERGGRMPAHILWEQITATFGLILLGAAALSAFLGDYKNAFFIFAAAILNAALGFFQNYRAEHAIAALKKMSMPNVRVTRGGNQKKVSARELAPGDVIQLESGNIIPADVRLLEAVNLRIQEASLTGESESIQKHTAALSGEDLPLGDRRNMAYMGTIVTQGRGLALVVATGMNTELGKIADLIQQVQPKKAPLQRRLNQLGKTLAQVGVGISALIFVLGWMRGGETPRLLLAAVGAAVALVPSSLPAVILVTLMLRAQRMLRHQALIRKLPAAETLGSVTVICSDKTGTLTENRMTVVVLDVAEHALDLSEEVERSGSLSATRGLGAPVQSSLSLAAIAGALCNDAKLIDTGDNRYHTLGDSTEGALVVAAAKMGYWKSSLDASFPRAGELPFDSERKRMTTIHHLEKYNPEFLSGLEISSHRYIAFAKGNVNNLLDVCSHIWVNGKYEPLDAKWRAKMQAANERLSKKGMRVLGIAFRLINALPNMIETDLEKNLTLVGLFGMIDPPRAEVKDAVATCRAAGIRPVMITGDNPLTALEIARQLGMSENGRAITGAEIESLSFDELKNIVDEVSVFARVAPEHKLRIVRALQEKGHIVAMTGDSLNDAPALRKADIGVAMGISGTDVSKEASDLILLDDNFATIIAAVREGRAVYENLRRFMRFSAAGNIGKALVMLLAPFLDKALPLLALQLLWLNIVTDGLLGLGMGAERPKTDSMKHAPYSSTDGIFTRKAGAQTIWLGAFIGALAVSLGAWYFFAGKAEWQTMIFTALAFMQIFHALASRSNEESLFNMGVLSNPLLAGMALLTVILQMAVMYISALANFFQVVPLSGCDLSIAAASGVVVFAVMEAVKKLRK